MATPLVTRPLNPPQWLSSYMDLTTTDAVMRALPGRAGDACQGRIGGHTYRIAASVLQYTFRRERASAWAAWMRHNPLEDTPPAVWPACFQHPEIVRVLERVHTRYEGRSYIQFWIVEARSGAVCMLMTRDAERPEALAALLRVKALS